MEFEHSARCLNGCGKNFTGKAERISTEEYEDRLEAGEGQIPVRNACREAEDFVYWGMVIEKVLLAAQGYIELDMPEEALHELDSLPDGAKECEPAMHMRLFVLMRSRQWSDAIALCARMRMVMPENTTGFLHGAFCLHELGRTSEARALLLGGPDQLKQEPTYHYNLGCYAAVLGDQEEARRYLNASFQLDKKFREIARLDPDLRSVKELL